MISSTKSLFRGAKKIEEKNIYSTLSKIDQETISSRGVRTLQISATDSNIKTRYQNRSRKREEDVYP